MKRFLFLTLGVLALGFAACSSDSDDDNGTPTPPPPTHSVTIDESEPTDQDIWADDEEATGVSFTTTGAWTSQIADVTDTRGSEMWVSISPESGDKAGDYTITITAEPNTTGKDRTAEIRIICGAQPVVITVTQKGLTEQGHKENTFVTFEDAAFKAYCVENFDTDGDGKISLAEAEVVTEINVSGTWNAPGSITSLTGIEHFTALTRLSCYYNQLTTLDVSNNTALTYLSCGSNQLTALDVSNNTALTELSCGSNQLTALDVSKNTALTMLECRFSQLSTLDVSQNPYLTSLSCYQNPNLTEVWAVFDFGISKDAHTIVKIKDGPVVIKESGTVGTLTWELTGQGMLIISGEGEMPAGTFGNPNGDGNMLWPYYNFSAVEIKEGVTSIGDFAFWDCRNMKSITIPESVTKIGTGAFAYSGLTSITIPGSCKNIGVMAFAPCENLTNVVISEGVETIGNMAFSNCTKLASVTIPGSVVTIPMGAFSNCTKLTSITISEGVEEIQSSAFSDCRSLTSITLPASLQTLENTFGSCTSLTSVTCLATTPPNRNGGIPRTVPIYVPAGSVEAYRTLKVGELLVWGYHTISAIQ